MEHGARVHLLIAAVLAGAALLGAAPARARVLMTQKDALAIAFPGAAKAVETAARSRLPSKVWTYYVAGSTTAYFESHLVRTMNETVMVVVGAGGEVRFVEILSFIEPDEYMASKRWLDQLSGRRLDDELALRRGLRNIAGASLTAEAVTRSVRRALAVHQVLNAKPAK